MTSFYFSLFFDIAQWFLVIVVFFGKEKQFLAQENYLVDIFLWCHNNEYTTDDGFGEVLQIIFVVKFVEIIFMGFQVSTLPREREEQLSTVISEFL